MNALMLILFVLGAGWLIASANYGIPGPIRLLAEAYYSRTSTPDTDDCDTDIPWSDDDGDDATPDAVLSVPEVTSEPLRPPVVLRGDGAYRDLGAAESDPGTSFQPVPDRRPGPPRKPGSGALSAAQRQAVLERRAWVRARMRDDWQPTRIETAGAVAFGCSEKTIQRDRARIVAGAPD